MSISVNEVFLLLENPKKSNNLGSILRCAAAYGIRTVVFVGYEKCATEGSHGAAKHVNIVAFPTLDQAVHFLRSSCECKSFVGLLGGSPDAYQVDGYEVEEDLISGNIKLSQQQHTSLDDDTGESTKGRYPRSFPVHGRPFLRKGNCCFLVTKNWKGLPTNLAGCCDFFVHVPHAQVGQDNEGVDYQILDIPSCLSIVLHHFTAAAGYDERAFQGHKFEVQQGIKLALKSEKKISAARREQQQEKANEVEDMLQYGSSENIFGNGDSGDY